MTTHMVVIVCMAMSAINVAFFAQDLSRWWNCAGAVFCFGLGIATAIQGN